MKDFAKGFWNGGDSDSAQAPGTLPPTNAELTQAAVPVSATTNNTRNGNTDIQNNVTVNVPPGADANAIAGAVGNQMQQSGGQLALAAEGAVR